MSGDQCIELGHDFAPIAAGASHAECTRCPATYQLGGDRGSGDIIAFLTARLDEDAQEIAKHPDDADYGYGSGLFAAEETGYPALPYLRITKRRALATVEADRRILAVHNTPAAIYPHTLEKTSRGCVGCGTHWTGERIVDDVNNCPILRALAHRHADHPDHDPAWATP